jgi:hypothetical protein
MKETKKTYWRIMDYSERLRRGHRELGSDEVVFLDKDAACRRAKEILEEAGADLFWDSVGVCEERDGEWTKKTETRRAGAFRVSDGEEITGRWGEASLTVVSRQPTERRVLRYRDVPEEVEVDDKVYSRMRRETEEVSGWDASDEHSFALHVESEELIVLEFDSE